MIQCVIFRAASRLPDYMVLPNRGFFFIGFVCGFIRFHKSLRFFYSKNCIIDFLSLPLHRFSARRGMKIKYGGYSSAG
jgi:hypothetical protein